MVPLVLQDTYSELINTPFNVSINIAINVPQLHLQRDINVVIKLEIRITE